jgi:hypothetical protein
MGKSSGSANTQVQMSPGQERITNAQTDFLTNTAFPAYQKVLGMANDVYGNTNPNTTWAAQNAQAVTGRTGATQENVGVRGLNTGMQGLAALFDPQYEQQQVDAALQAGRESARESQAGQNAMYGAAGGLGGSRMALADSNMASLNAQRQATAAANARAGVQANKAAAANQLATLGGQNLTSANQAAGAQIGYAGTPQDVLAKYASVLFGTPQASTTPNFANTQSSRTSGKSAGISI